MAVAIAGPGFYSLDRRLGLLRWRIPLFAVAMLVSAGVVALTL